jgi:hypothetical protein
MPHPISQPDTIFTLSPNIQVLPIVHGSGDMAQTVRDIMVSQKIDCLALPLPPSVEFLVEEGIAALPVVSVVVCPEKNDDEISCCSYVPIDPCQPVIMGIRVAMGEGIARAYVDRDVTCFQPTPWVGPDPYVLKSVSLASFSAVTMPFVPSPQQDSQRQARISWMAFRLHELELEYRNIVCLCSLVDWPWLRQAYQGRMPYVAPEQPTERPAWWKVDPASLYFLLGELPFITQLYEYRREEARSDKHLSIDGIKELVLEARSRWLASRSSTGAQEVNWITPQLLQRFIQYIRNRTLLEHRLKPDLYTLVQAAQQMGGDAFALTLLETAKTYDYQIDSSKLDTKPTSSMGIGACKETPKRGEVSRFVQSCLFSKSNPGPINGIPIGNVPGHQKINGLNRLPHMSGNKASKSWELIWREPKNSAPRWKMGLICGRPYDNGLRTLNDLSMISKSKSRPQLEGPLKFSCFSLRSQQTRMCIPGELPGLLSIRKNLP